ncbi:MAG TPA: hypothetical protein VJQ56_00910 [Blastocatellia bacterium]|nr:hypothetical protein [Blastocatellia bacterium]
MNDDYLWNKEGEPDAEIERLENLLVRFRHKPVAPPQIAARPRFYQPGFYSTQWAAAAVVILAVLAALTFLAIWKAARTSNNPNVAEVTAPKGDEGNAEKKPEQVRVPQPPEQTPGSDEIAAAPAPAKATRRAPSVRPRVEPREAVERVIATQPQKEKIAVEYSSDEISNAVAFLNPETSKHFEKSQMLLRAFRNVAATDGAESVDVSFEKEQSKNLLYRNILLRRDAEAKRNLPMEDVLGSLEPILLDIANLPSTASREEISAIKERMQKKDIVTTLQVYSTQTLMAGR